MVRTFMRFFALGAMCGLLGVSLGCAAAHMVELEHPVSDTLVLCQVVAQGMVSELLAWGSPLVGAGLGQLAGLSSELELKRLAPWPYLPAGDVLVHLAGLSAGLLALVLLGTLVRRHGRGIHALVASLTAKIVAPARRAETSPPPTTALPFWWQDVRGRLPARLPLDEDQVIRIRR